MYMTMGVEVWGVYELQLIYRPRWDGRLSWPIVDWPTRSGQFTYKLLYLSIRHRAQGRVTLRFVANWPH